MRKTRWIAPVWGMLAAAAFGQTASAQAPMSPLDAQFPPVAPPPSGYPGQPTYTPIAPDAASPAGYPPGMEPWPAISPYDHAVDTTYNDRGIWFREMLNHNRKYKLTAEFISGSFRQPGDAPVGVDDRIGTTLLPEVPAGHRETRDGVHPFSIYGIKDFMLFEDRGRYFDATDGAAGSPATSGPLPRIAPLVIFANRQVPGPNGFTLSSPLTDDLIFAEPKTGVLQVSNFGDTPQNADFNDADDVDTDEVADTMLYPVSGQVFGEDAVTLFGGDPDVVQERRENPRSPGLRLSFGLEDEDESGFEWNAYWLSGAPTVFSRGTNDPSRPRVTNIIFFDAPWLGTGEAVIPGLDTVNTTNAVEMLDYNTLFELKHETEFAGTDLSFFHTPMVDYGWLRLRPLYGARYNYIREQFNFTGRDNGRSYAFDADGDIWDQSSQPTGNATVVNNNLVPNTLTDPFFETLINPYETSVTSKVQSHLYGPQLGFDVSAGGEHLMLTAVTKAGVVVNTEKLSLATTGFGSTEALTGVRPFRTDAKTHTRVVPFLEFNANADINVFPIIPVVNRWQFLKNARVRAGWTTLVAGNIQRPLDQVVWRSDASGGAYIKERGRDAWYTQYWNVGVNWTF